MKKVSVATYIIIMNWHLTHNTEAVRALKYLKELSYLFIDEAQDLSAPEAEFMHGLIRLFNLQYIVVGDQKQCINQFKGANINNMFALPYD